MSDRLRIAADWRGGVSVRAAILYLIVLGVTQQLVGMCADADNPGVSEDLVREKKFSIEAAGD